MPAFLKHDEQRELLTLSLGGMRGDEFKDALARAKSIPGRRWNPDTKNWEYPDDADTAIRIMMMLAPVADAAVKGLVAARTEQVANDLITRIPPDAELHVDLWGWYYDPDLAEVGEGQYGTGWFLAESMPHQRSGVEWLMEHPHSIIGDEMGVGKGPTAIGSVLEARALGQVDPEAPTLIVAPAPLTGTWEDTPNSPSGAPREAGTWVEEIDRWAREEAVVINGKTPIKRKQQLEDALERKVPWIIVNWEKLQDRVKLVPQLRKVKWAAVVADEAHRARGHDTQQSRNLAKLRGWLELAMTGTPIMAHPGDLFGLLRWLRPEQYTGYWPFYYSYVDEYSTQYGSVVTGVKNVDQLRFELSDKLIRRLKVDVLKDLPEKLPPEFVRVPLKPKQQKLYDAAETDFFLDVEATLRSAVESEDEALARKIAAAAEVGDVKRLGYLIPNGAARTTRLRQIAANPAILGGPDESAKMSAAEELIRDSIDQPTIVFTWYVEAAELMAARLRKISRGHGRGKLRVGVIAGDAHDVDEVKHAFQNGELDIVVAGIAKGGVGLTLTRASHAIFVERDWTPGINKQAEDRLHRKGQKNAVKVTIIEAAGTIDTDNLARANRLKEMIAAQVLGTTQEE